MGNRNKIIDININVFLFRFDLNKYKKSKKVKNVSILKYNNKMFKQIEKEYIKVRDKNEK